MAVDAMVMAASADKSLRARVCADAGVAARTHAVAASAIREKPMTETSPCRRCVRFAA
jgi:hypothetical protein